MEAPVVFRPGSRLKRLDGVHGEAPERVQVLMPYAGAYLLLNLDDSTTFTLRGFAVHSDYELDVPTACPHCTQTPVPDEDGSIAHRCHGAKFWFSRDQWEAAVEQAVSCLGGLGPILSPGMKLNKQCEHRWKGNGPRCCREEDHIGRHLYKCSDPGCPGLSMPASEHRHPCGGPPWPDTNKGRTYDE